MTRDRRLAYIAAGGLLAISVAVMALLIQDALSLPEHAAPSSVAAFDSVNQRPLHPLEAAEPDPSPEPVLANRPPSLEIASQEPAIPIAGQLVVLNLRGSDPDGDDLQFEWKLAGDAEWQKAPEPRLALPMPLEGQLNLELRCIDGRDAPSEILTAALQPEPNPWLGWKQLYTLTEGVGTANQLEVCFSPDGTVLAVGTWNVRLFQVATGRQLKVIPLPQQAIRVQSLAFSPDGQSLTVCADRVGQPPFLDRYRLADGRPIGRLTESEVFQQVAIAPGGRLLAIPVRNDIRVLLAEDQSEVGAFRGHEGEVTRLGFSLPGTLISAGLDHRLRFWDIKEGSTIRDLRLNTTPRFIALSSDERTVAEGDYMTARLVRATDGAIYREIRSPHQVQSFAFSSTGRHFALASQGVEVWGEATRENEQIQLAFRDQQRVSTAAAEKEDRKLATAEKNPVELAAAIDKKLVTAVITGAGLSRVELRLEPTGQEPLTVQVSAGTLFLSDHAGVQNMVATRDVRFTLAGIDRKVWRSIPAACANMSRNTPSVLNHFSVVAPTERATLTALVRSKGFTSKSARVQQFAVWIVTDNPALGGLRLVTVVDGNIGPGIGPSEKELAAVKELLETAGLQVAKYRAFGD